MQLTRRQRALYEYLKDHFNASDDAPSLDELCAALGVSSRGSLHKHIQALVEAGLVEPLNGKHRGIRLRHAEPEEEGLPLLGTIAAGQPIEALPHPEYMKVPDQLRTNRPCYVLRVKGDSMIDAGILDGDYVVIEQREAARNGEIVVALVNNNEVTLKRIEQRPGKVILHPENAALKPLTYAPTDVQIQGVVVGQMRRY